ncbi:hypothetical protein LTR49_012792 [Elasticomyces elasticus]|nr:hypothetical protein LTR49_012792 [Elasticomyces elasticus]KAK5763112.1 hypothetical protein LTS12_006701 [Elasticomyces elasticus]
MMYGYDAGVLGGVLLHKPFLDAIGNPTDTYTIPMIVASYDLAAFVTAIAITPYTFRLGRRGTVIMGNIVAIIGSLLQASSYSVAQLIVGRLCTGFAIGCISSAVPTYLSETGVEIGDRGPANISGVPLAYWIDYGFIMMDNQASWRIPIVFQCIFAFLSGGTMYFLPDTPRWYYARKYVSPCYPPLLAVVPAAPNCSMCSMGNGISPIRESSRWDEGDAALAQLNDSEVDSEKVQNTRREILAAIEAELEANASLNWKQFVTMGFTDHTRLKVVRRLVMCFWLPMIREWMGSSLLAYYSSIILATVARPGLVSLLSGVLNIFYALGCVPLYFTVERVGRRSVLLYGAIVMTVLLSIFTALVAVGPGHPNIQWASIGVLFLFLFVFGYSWQGCVWLYCSEIAPLEYRHIGGAFTASGEWLMTFITVFAGPIGFDGIGWYFWLWVISGNVVAIIFVFLLCPETGGKTLEQVDYLFVRPGFAGLRSNFDITEEDVEDAFEAKPKTNAIEQREETGTYEKTG